MPTVVKLVLACIICVGLVAGIVYAFKWLL